jgi:hypothetical protein
MYRNLDALTAISPDALRPEWAKEGDVGKLEQSCHGSVTNWRLTSP